MRKATGSKSKHRFWVPVAGASCFLLACFQACACPYAGAGDTVFFGSIPSPQPNADLIAEVSLSDIKPSAPPMITVTATATVMQVIKAFDANIHQGDKFAMKYDVTSCGPNYKNGYKGTIIAKAGVDGEGRVVLYPYMQQYEGKRLVRDPLTYSVREKLPQPPSSNRDELAKLNARCAAFYDFAKLKVNPAESRTYVARLNAHKLYAKRLHQSTQSFESRYEADLSTEKSEFEKAKAEGALLQHRDKWDRYCPSVELHTSLSIQAHKLKLNP